MGNDENWNEKIAARLDQLCKPPGSLGGIELAASQLCRIQKTLRPVTRPCQVTIFAADHGVTSEGVTSWPSEVTRSVVQLMERGRTASGVFAESLGCRYEVVDVGLLQPTSSSRGQPEGHRRGTGNILQEPAMTDAEFDHAWSVGAKRAKVACDDGSIVLIGGEMGIGNTTAASSLIGLLADADAGTIVGRGAGIDDEAFERKKRVVRGTIDRVRSLGINDPKEIAAQAGGLELVALAGFYSEGARRGATLIIDGLIATAAALIAFSIDPSVRDCMIAGHQSSEPGHVIALGKLQLEPILNLQMRLGEGTGALAALPILDLAVVMLTKMASLDELTSGLMSEQTSDSMSERTHGQ